MKLYLHFFVFVHVSGWFFLKLRTDFDHFFRLDHFWGITTTFGVVTHYGRGRVSTMPLSQVARNPCVSQFWGWLKTTEVEMVTRARTVCFRRSVTPLHLHKCVARFGSDSWFSCQTLSCYAKRLAFLLSFLSTSAGDASDKTMDDDLSAEFDTSIKAG